MAAAMAAVALTPKLKWEATELPFSANRGLIKGWMEHVSFINMGPIAWNLDISLHLVIAVQPLISTVALVSPNEEDQCVRKSEENSTLPHP